MKISGVIVLNLTISLELHWVFLVHTQFRCGKIRSRKTPNTGTFHAVLCAEAKAGPTQTSKIESLAKIVYHFQPLATVAMLSSLDVCGIQGTPLIHLLSLTFWVKLPKKHND